MEDTWKANELKVRTFAEGAGKFGYEVMSVDGEGLIPAAGYGFSSDAAARKAGQAAVDRLVGTRR
jgi:hypothetical protein